MTSLAKWAALAVGFGVAFEMIALALDIRYTFLLSHSSVLCPACPATVIGTIGKGFFQSDLHTIAFGWFFYGAILLGVGLSMLFVRYLMNREPLLEGKMLG